MSKYFNITIENAVDTKPTGNSHVLIATVGKIKNLVSGRDKDMILKNLKCIIVDEADHIFGDEKNL